MSNLEKIEGFVEDKIKRVKDKAIILKTVSVRTWVIIGIIFAFLCAFWEWLVGWIGHLILGKPFFIYPFSSLKYTDPTGIATWGAFAVVTMFIAMHVAKLTAVKNVMLTVKEDYVLIKDYLSDKFVLPKRIRIRHLVIAGVIGAIVGTICEGLGGFIFQFVRGHIVWIYPDSILKYTSFASIPIWGMFSVVYFVLTYNLILILEKNQIEHA
jgi:hypothetical protein